MTTPNPIQETAEGRRLEEARTGAQPWRRWGPVPERAPVGHGPRGLLAEWHGLGLVPHDHARSRAYRWGEDGLGGISDDRQRLCFAIALWNGADDILKERPFGLTNGEGNHGEDVKECYFYLDNTPTHAYMKYLYKYPWAKFPYADLVAENARRKADPHNGEYELLDTGVFDGSRYVDVMVEYAKAGPDDILVRVSATNRGPDRRTLHLLPTLWFRNTWSWNPAEPRQNQPSPGGPESSRHPRSTPWRPTRCTARAPGPGVHRERFQPRAAGLGTQPVPIRQGRVPRVCGQWPVRCRQPGADRHESRGALPAGPRAR